MRRWAAAVRVATPDDIAPAVRAALRLDSRHAAAAVHGLVDATDRLDPDDAAGMLDIGLDWPTASVRLAALRRLIGSGRRDEALQRAARDPAAYIRRWAAKQRATPQHLPASEQVEAPTAAGAVEESPTRQVRDRSQQRLFDW
jgi:hypothetical protein